MNQNGYLKMLFKWDFFNPVFSDNHFMEFIGKH
jgi:hypothetical protein